MILDRVFQKRVPAKTQSEKGADEKLSRSIAKSVSWRIIGTIDTILISWVVTGTLTMALSIGLVELVTKMTLYVLHERAWNKISWGK